MKRRRVDYLGAIGTTAIVYWGYHVLDPAGPDPLTFALPVLALAAIASFIMVEQRAEEPIVPLRLFGISTVSIVSGVSLVSGSVTLGMFFYFGLYMA